MQPPLPRRSALRTPSLSPIGIVVATVVLACACERKDPPGAAITPTTGVAKAGSASASPTPKPPPAASSSAPVALPDTSASASPATSASAPTDWKNEAQPARLDADLERKGKALLEAIVEDDPSLAEGFFFPREPFTPLKDSKNPDRYWKHLYRAYENDIHKLHRRRRDWSGVTFERIDPGTPSVWVPPGDEANKIGYFRSWGTKLRYRIDGQLYTVKIHTVISWQGTWYITHLLPWKKK